MSRFSFYCVSSSDDSVNPIPKMQHSPEEYFVGQYTYGRQQTLERFRKELLMTGEEESILIAEKGDLSDVVLLYRTQFTPVGFYGFKFKLCSENGKGPRVFSCWCIDVNAFYAKYWEEAHNKKYMDKEVQDEAKSK